MNYDFSVLLQMGLLTVTNRRKKSLAEAGNSREIFYNKTKENLVKLNYSEKQMKTTLRDLK